MNNLNIEKEITGNSGRFVTLVDGLEAELTFSIANEQLIIADHTGVPESLGGQGVGKALVLALIADARANSIKIIPLCPFVKAQYARHPEWSDVMTS